MLRELSITSGFFMSFRTAGNQLPLAPPVLTGFLAAPPPVVLPLLGFAINLEAPLPLFWLPPANLLLFLSFTGNPIVKNFVRSNVMMLLERKKKIILTASVSFPVPHQISLQIFQPVWV